MSEKKPVVLYLDRGMVARVWRLEGDFWHRLGGPAVEMEDGTKQWWVEDVLVRSESLLVPVKTRFDVLREERRA